MKTTALLIAGLLLVCSTLLLRAGPADVSLAGAGPARGSGIRLRRAANAAASRATRSCAALLAFFDRRLEGLDGNGRACADCHMATDDFQLSPAGAEARFRRLQMRRTRHPDADDPLFRPIDADDFRTNGEDATDFSNLRQNGLVRITLTLPSNIKVVDPATNAPSADTFVDVWRSVPSVNNVALTGPDDVNPVAARPERVRRLPAGRAGRDAPGAGARRADESRRDPAARPATAARRPVGVPARPVHEPPRAPAVRRRPSGGEPASGYRSPAHATSNGRARSSSSARARSVTVVRDNRHRRCRWSGFTTSPRSVRGPSTPRRRHASRLRRARRNSPAMPGPTRSRLANGTKIRRTSSDPGRALLTGFVGGPAPADDWNKLDMPGLLGISRTAPYFHNNSAATLEDVVDHYIEFFKRVQANARARRRPADRLDRRGQLRSAAHAGGARGAHRVSPNAVAGERATRCGVLNRQICRKRSP